MSAGAAQKQAMSDCDQARELLPAYSIGATDDDETRLVDSQLKRCPDLVEELARLRDVGEAIAHDVPQTAPPPHMLNQLLSAAKQSRTQKRQRRGWIAAAAAVAALFLINNLYWISRLESAAVRAIDLPPAVSGEASDAAGRVIWSGETGKAVLIAANFPTLTDDSTYQAWVRRGETVTSLGIFRVDDTGNGLLVFDAARLREPFDILGVTTEPIGGSPAPTGDPVVRWRAG